MIKDITFSIIELGIGLVFEAIVVGLIFQQMSNRTQQENETNLRAEMKKIESQNKFDYQQLQKEIRDAKNDLISQIKESSKK